MVKRAGEWAEVDWPEALEAAAQGLKDVVARHGARGARRAARARTSRWRSCTSARSLARGLGTRQHRPSRAPVGFPREARRARRGSACRSRTSATLQSVLLVGSTLRKEQPLLAARLRQAAKKGLAVNVRARGRRRAADAGRESRGRAPDALAGDARRDRRRGRAGHGQARARRAQARRRRSKAHRREPRRASERSAILLGHYAQQHPDFAVLLAIAQEIGRVTGATVGVLPDGANAVGAHLAGARARSDGLDARAMVDQAAPRLPRGGRRGRARHGPAALAALAQSEFTVVLSAYRNATTERAHVMLPIAPFTETGGTFVNMEGRAQSFNAVVKPQGDARPGWKVLRMLGALLEIAGLPRRHARGGARADRAGPAGVGARGPRQRRRSRSTWELRTPRAARRAHRRIRASTRTDPIVRRSPPLQKTADGKAARTRALQRGDRSRAWASRAGDTRARAPGRRRGDPRRSRSTPRCPKACVRIARGVAGDRDAGRGRHRRRAGRARPPSHERARRRSRARQGMANQRLRPGVGPAASTPSAARS